MKPIIRLLVFFTVAGVCVQARAQTPSSAPDTDPEVNSEPAQTNVPAMVVREAPAQEKLAQDKTAQGNNVVSVPGSAAKGATGHYTTKPAVFSAVEPTIITDETTGNPTYDRLVMESAAKNEVDPKLIMAVMRQESRFNPNSRSYKGACGLMQLMPDTARRFGVANIYDAAQNIEGGAKYLRFLLDKFDGDVPLALAGYNAGEMAVVGAGYKIPRFKETQNYVRTISARYGATGHPEPTKAGKAAPKLPSTVVLSSSVLSNNY
jgi:soluble lytic murein transglycosylase-like protein